MRFFVRMFYWLFFLIICLVAYYKPLPSVTDNSDEGSRMSLMEQEAKYEKEKGEYLQNYVLDKILGPDKAVVIVDIELGLETKTTKQAAQERKTDNKKRLGDIEYLLPGVPNPKSVSQETAPGESKEESGQAAETKIEVKTVVKKQDVTILYDEGVNEERLAVVREAITAFLKIDTKRGDKIDMKKTKFTRVFWGELTRPGTLVPIIMALLLLFFLFGPVSSFLSSYIRTMRERGGTEVTVDSKIEGGPEGEGKGGGKGGPGALGRAELERIEAEKKKYKPFNYVDQENLKRLIYLIRNEHPQTIALVVSYLKPEFMLEMISSLPVELQAEVALEMATIRQMTQDRVMEIDNDIKDKIDFLIGGIEHLLKVLDEVDKNTRENILEYLRNERPELYRKIRKFIIMFDDIPNFPDQAMQTVIRELKSESLAKALRNASPDILNKFFSNMSANAAAVLKEEMEYGRPLTTEEIDEERKKILDVIKVLERDGKIFVREKHKSKMLEGAQDLEETASFSGEAGQYFDAAVQLYNSGQYEEALQYFEYCAQVDPGRPEFHQYLGSCYYSLGRTKDAVSAYEKALQLNPGNQELKDWLAAEKNAIG